MSKQDLKFVAYLRVSTIRQGRSGLGLEAQRAAVQAFVTGRAGSTLVAELVEVESGKKNNRPQLQRALNTCRITGATLIVAKLDRLSRNAAFLMTLRDSGIDFVAADLPEANTMTVGIMAVVAQHEREAISARTKAALAAAKARGKVLGGRRVGSPNIGDYQSAGVVAVQKIAYRNAELRRDALLELSTQGLSLNAMALRLNNSSIRTSRGGGWTPTAVRRMLGRLGLERLKDAQH